MNQRWGGGTTEVATAVRPGVMSPIGHGSMPVNPARDVTAEDGGNVAAKSSTQRPATQSSRSPSNGQTISMPRMGGQAQAQSPPTGVVMVSVTDVSPSPYQPRRTFDPEALQRLADSIRRSGLMQPIVVRPKNGRFELIAGERRWLAATQVGLAMVPAMVRDVDDREAAELSLVENMQREDLDPMERCHGFRNLMEQFGLTQAEVARQVGVERSTVANLVRLVELESEIQEMVSRGALGLGHAKALLALPGGPSRVHAAHTAVKKGWTVRKLEQAGSRGNGGGDAKPRAVEIADLEERLTAHLGTRVSVMLGRDKKKGKLVIEFYGIDHFEGLVSRMGFKGGV